MSLIGSFGANDSKQGLIKTQLLSLSTEKYEKHEKDISIQLMLLKKERKRNQ